MHLKGAFQKKKKNVRFVLKFPYYDNFLLLSSEMLTAENLSGSVWV